uniref:Uncharacterized protein n=1 Tax=Anopheles minimus TaxID=112268 RepID=A0A182WND2_9DIPT
MTMGSGVQKLL